MNHFIPLLLSFIMQIFIANGGFVYAFFTNVCIKISNYYFNVWPNYLSYILL